MIKTPSLDSSSKRALMGKKRKSFAPLVKGAAIAAALFVCAAFASCDFGFDGDSFQNKAGAYFKEMTSTAAINSYSISPDGLPTDKYGNTCLDFDNTDGYVVTFTLRNPQHYSFNLGSNMQFYMPGQGLVDADTVKIAQDGGDTTRLTVTYPSDFLKANPNGANISPIITLMHPISYVNFGAYSDLKLSSNAVPPVAGGAIAMQTTETPSTWVLCFNMPSVGVIKAYHSDIVSVSVNGQSFDAEIENGKIAFSNGGTTLVTTKPNNITANQITGNDFEANGQPVYFFTGDPADDNERFYKITVADDAGLSSDLNVSTKGLRVKTPGGYAVEDTEHAHPYTDDGSQNVSNENDDGTGSMRLWAEAITDGTEQYSYDPSNASIIYEVYTDEECENLLSSGKIKGLEGVINVPGGDSYIKAYARKPLYADSKVIKWKSRVVRAALYVAPESMGGSDSNDGSRDSPLLTVKKAVELFKAAIANGDYGETSPITASLEIRVKGDLDGQPAIDLGSLDSTMTYEGTLKILGWEGTRAVASASTSDPAISIPAGKKALIENIKLSGSYDVNGVQTDGQSLEMNGCEISGFSNNLVVQPGATAAVKKTKLLGAATAGIWVNPGATSLTCEDCEISGNGVHSSSASNCGVYVGQPASVSFTGGKITGNKGVKGAGMHVEGSVSLDGVEFSGNEATTKGSSDAAGGAICLDSTAELSIKGNNQIFGNTADGKVQDIFLCSDFIDNNKKIEVTGSLAGSKIGVCAAYPTDKEPKEGEPVVFTNGYGANNPGVKPGAIFKGQKGPSGALYNVADHGGQAAFALGGGGSGYDAGDYSFDIVLKETAAEAAAAQTTMEADPTAAVAPEARVAYTAKSATFWLAMRATRAKDGETAKLLYCKDGLLYADSACTVEAVDEGYADTKTVEITASVWQGSVKKGAATVAWDSTAGRFKLTVPDTAISLGGSYAIKIETKFLKTVHASSAALTVSKSADAAAFYISGLAAAGTYPVAVEGPVGPRKIGVSGATVNDGLAKVAAAISGAPANVCISLDASATAMDSDAEDYILNYNGGKYFMGCAALKSVVLPDWMEYIIEDLFNGCAALDSVTLSANTQVIMKNAFNGCSSLASITLPEGITGASSDDDPHGIREGAFVGCKSGFAITYGGTKEQWSKIKRPVQSGSGAAPGDWHDGLAEEDANNGSVTCSDGKCGFDYRNPLTVPLTLETTENGTEIIYHNMADGSVYYWIDGVSEIEISAGETQTITLDAGHKVEFYGNNPRNGNEDQTRTYPTVTCDKPCYVYGNFMSLVNKRNFATEVTLTDDYAFCHFFNASNNQIMNKPGQVICLPATTLTKNCYAGMFENCSGLQTAPDLPATTLAEGCYANMFSNCSLTSAPALPATTLAKSCYYSMFYSCEFTDAPTLPATTLAEGCYEQMFMNCSSLSNAPALPARTLAESCYHLMFKYCESLVKAPALPATTLANSCYKSMFAFCTSLVDAPTLPATTLAEYCYDSMFYGCASLATAPALPAMELKIHCYESMFELCTNLTTAPVLGAPRMVSSCYNRMFNRCEKLISITCLATTIAVGGGGGTTNNWVYGVSPTGTFIYAAGTDWSGKQVDFGIPTGWTAIPQ